jgi:prefoldin subunit 5
MVQMYMDSYPKSTLTAQLKTLQQEIDQLRESMHKIAKEKNSLSDPAVVHISQLLDEKLNLHHKAYTHRSH